MISTTEEYLYFKLNRVCLLGTHRHPYVLKLFLALSLHLQSNLLQPFRQESIGGIPREISLPVLSSEAELNTNSEMKKNIGCGIEFHII